MIFLEGDLSQIESRIVFMLTGDPELVRLARLPSYEYDAHTENAKYILGAKPSDPDFKLKRHVGKIVSHGAQRDMHGNMLSNQILKELGILVPVDVCSAHIEAYHQRYPAIRNSYFFDIRRQMMREKMLVNSWGRRIDFRFDRLSDALYRKGYSFPPQSENADLLNRRGLLPTWKYMKATYNRPPNVQVHDSLLCSVPAVGAYDLARVIQKNLEQPIMLNGHRFTPFVEFKLGKTWAGSVEFKKLPSKEEFTEAALQLEGEQS